MGMVGYFGFVGSGCIVVGIWCVGGFVGGMDCFWFGLFLVGGGDL